MLTDVERGDMIHNADLDGNGTLDFSEFLFMMERRMNSVDNEAEIKSIFKVYDMDGNGFISADKLKHMMTQVGEPLTGAEVDDFIRVVDVNKDGQINCEEFLSGICLSHRLDAN